MKDELFKFKDQNIEVYWQEFCHKPYKQFNNNAKFKSHMSIVDYLFNCGRSNLTAYIKDCHQEIL